MTQRFGSRDCGRALATKPRSCPNAGLPIFVIDQNEMEDFTFIVYDGQKLSRREQELRLSRAKSHIAKTCQRRRRMSEERGALLKQRQKPLAPKRSSDLQDMQRKPAPTLYKGNSDPFDSTAALQVTPRIHQTIVFLQHGFLPTNFPAGKNPGWARGLIGKAHLLERIRSLLSQPAGLTEILPYTTMLATSCGGLQQDVLSFQLQVIRGIKEAILDLTANLDSVLLFTKALFSAALIQHDMDAARIHGSALGFLLSYKVELTGCFSLNFNFVMHTLYYVQELAHISLSRPIIDVSSWAEQYVRHISGPVVQYLEPLHHDFESLLDPCISDDGLRQSYRSLYETVWLWRHETQPAPEITQYMLGAYCIIQHNIDAIRLANYFANFRDELDGAASDAAITSTEEAYLVCQAVLALCLLAYLATFVSSSVVGSRYIWKKHMVFLSQLKGLLTTKLNGQSFEEGEFGTEYRNAFLCAYWIGATWELKEGRGSAWFYERFFKLCERMNLRSWCQVESVLDNFMLAKTALPTGSAWVEPILALANADKYGDIGERQAAGARPGTKLQPGRHT